MTLTTADRAFFVGNLDAWGASCSLPPTSRTAAPTRPLTHTIEDDHAWWLTERRRWAARWGIAAMVALALLSLAAFLGLKI